MFGGFPFEEMFGGGGMPGGGGRRRGGPPDDDDGDDDNEEYYNVLGVEKSAVASEIKKAFRKLSRKFHPDRPQGDEAKFKDIQEAYEVLSDPHKRDLYNEGGKKAVKNGGVGPENIFDAMFGGGGRRKRGGRQKEKASEISKVMDITLEDVYKGPTKDLPYKYMTASGRKVCSHCNGRGAVMQVIRQGFMQIQTQAQCPECDGRGVSFANEEMVSKTARVHIPPGIRHGDKITLSGEGHSIPGVERGDVKITVRVRKHRVFERVGADLACKKTITLQEALCGHTFKLKHVSGNTLVVSAKPGDVTNPGCIKQVTDWGLPQKGGHGMQKGHLYIKYEIIFPTQNSISAGDVGTLTAVLGRCRYPEVKEKAPEIEVGSMVKIVNLAQYPQFNNKIGMVFSETRSGRWGIELKGGKQLSVPAEKLELIVDDPEPKQKKPKTTEEEDMEDEYYEEEVSPDMIEGEPETTPAVAASDAYDEEEDNRERQHECRTM